MPKSKRERLLTLAQTKKKGKVLKENVFEGIRESVDMYSYAYVVSVENERNNIMKQVREYWSSSKFFFGKNKVMLKALGRTAVDSFRPDLYKLSKLLRGKRGLFLTNSSPEEVNQYFESIVVEEFARPGVRCTSKVELKNDEEGLAKLERLAFTMEPVLRQLGLPTKLEKGKIVLLKDSVICKEGEILSPEQCRLLKLLDHKIAEFSISVLGVWSQEHGFSQISEDVDAEETIELDQEIDMEEEEGLPQLMELPKSLAS